MANRYAASEHFEHGCCWGATVVDTDNIICSKPMMVCECDNMESAQRIADALNGQQDAERYRWLCDGNGYFMEENSLCGHENEKEAADVAIDLARSFNGAS